MNGSHRVGRRWVAKGTPIGGALHLQLPPEAKLNLILRTKLDGVLAVIPSDPDGIPSIGDFKASRDGWVEFRLGAAGLPDQGVPFRLPTTYTATTELR